MARMGLSGRHRCGAVLPRRRYRGGAGRNCGDLVRGGDVHVTISDHVTRSDRAAPRAAGVLMLSGVVLYILPSILHGNPPIDDAAATLEYVADASGWRIAHLVNTLPVVLWVIALSFLRTLPGPPGPLSRATGSVWAVAAGVFGVYFGIHAIGLSTAADQYLSGAVDRAAVVERTEALLLVLGSTAFVAQALLGLAVGLTGLLLARAE